MTKCHIRTVKFRRFKALKNFDLSLREMNVLVGPNNAGKSTVLSAFRILSEGIKMANAWKPEYDRRGDFYKYRVRLDRVGVSAENVFTDYDESEPATVEFILGEKRSIVLNFPEPGECFMHLICPEGPVKSPTDFRKLFSIGVGQVPILTPVDPREKLYEKEAARTALVNRTASRNFRNIWYHFPEKFPEFRDLINKTWPEMNICLPETNPTDDGVYLNMFCDEERVPRELFWSGSGFQIWCQLLTYILKAENNSVLLVDEPDIYLHPELQRRLISILRDQDCQVIMATHAPEIISEVDPNEIVYVDKKLRHSERLKSNSRMSDIFDRLGSALNPTLTQIARTNKALFVEGKDIKIISQFARKLNFIGLANRAGFVVLPVEGFNPDRVRDTVKGVEMALGKNLQSAVLFDRDFRSDQEISQVIDNLNCVCAFAWIHKVKEIENYLLDSIAISRCINRQLRFVDSIHQQIDAAEVAQLLREIAATMKHDLQGKYIAKHSSRPGRPGHDPATLHTAAIKEFDLKWESDKEMLAMIPGKATLSALNDRVQSRFGVTVTAPGIITNMRKEEIHSDISDFCLGISRALDLPGGTP